MHDSSDDSMDDLWERLTREERWCVFAYRTGRSQTAAANSVGKSGKWVEYHLRAHPAFRKAMESSEWRLDDMQKWMRVQLAAEGEVQLIKALLTGAEIQPTQIRAIKVAVGLGKR